MKIPEDCKKLIENKVVTIGTKGDFPNVTPVLYCKVVDEKVIITDNYMEETKKNLLADNKICLAVWDATPGKEYGYKLYGTCEYHKEGKWLEFVKKMKENQELPARGAIIFTSEKIKKI